MATIDYVISADLVFADGGAVIVMRDADRGPYRTLGYPSCRFYTFGAAAGD
jgi:hypothetical protein